MYVPLGQTIPWQCWDATGFKACHSAQWGAASEMCNSAAGKEVYEGDVGRCVEEQTYLLAKDACFALCPQPPSNAAVPVPMTDEEIEEAGGRPKSGLPWGAIAAVGGLVVAGFLLLGGVTMGRDYERKRSTA